MLSSLRNIFKVPDLRNKVLFTILMIVLYRFGAHLPGARASTPARSRRCAARPTRAACSAS